MNQKRNIAADDEEDYANTCIFNCSYAEWQASSEVSRDDADEVENVWNSSVQSNSQIPRPRLPIRQRSVDSTKSLLDNDEI